MRQRYWLFMALVAALVAGGTGQQLVASADAMAATSMVVVPAVEIAPHTRITPKMLTVRELPSVLAADPIYRDVSQVADRIAASRLQPGRPIYRDDAVMATKFHLSADDQLEVVALTVMEDHAPPAYALVGQRIKLYEAVVADGPGRALASGVLMTRVEPTLVATSALTVDVRSLRAADAPEGQLIITVAVSPALSSRIIAMQAGAPSAIWVTLAPWQEPIAAEVQLSR